MDQETSPDETVQGGQEDEVPGEAEAPTERTAAEQPNPFWSEQATEEFRLRQARTLGLAESTISCWNRITLRPILRVVVDSGLWKQPVFEPRALIFREVSVSKLRILKGGYPQGFLRFFQGPGVQQGKTMLR